MTEESNLCPKCGEPHSQHIVNQAGTARFCPRDYAPVVEALSSKTVTDLEAWIASPEGQRYGCTRQYPHPRYACDHDAKCVGCLMVAAALELRKQPDETDGDDLGSQIYALLVRRGYAQHEADAIANGPGCTNDCVQNGYPDIDCHAHGQRAVGTPSAWLVKLDDGWRYLGSTKEDAERTQHEKGGVIVPLYESFPSETRAQTAEAELAKWRTSCTGKHGSQMPCVESLPVEPSAVEKACRWKPIDGSLTYELGCCREYWTKDEPGVELYPHCHWCGDKIEEVGPEDDCYIHGPGTFPHSDGCRCSKCSSVKSARELSASEAASFDKTLARSPRRVEPSPPHAVEDDFQHWLSYTGGKGTLQQAFYAGADVPTPETVESEAERAKRIGAHIPYDIGLRGGDEPEECGVGSEEQLYRLRPLCICDNALTNQNPACPIHGSSENGKGDL